MQLSEVETSSRCTSGPGIDECTVGLLKRRHAIYDCSSLYSRTYKISGVYKLPSDEFMGTPELEVLCDMETNGGGWTVIQRRKVGLTSFNRDWKQYKDGFGNIRGDFWLGNEHIFRLTRQPTVLRIDMEDWEGQTRYAEYNFFTISNEMNSYKLFIANYSGNAGRDSLRYHNNTNFSTKNRDNDKCVDDCAQFRKDLPSKYSVDRYVNWQVGLRGTKTVQRNPKDQESSQLFTSHKHALQVSGFNHEFYFILLKTWTYWSRVSAHSQAGYN
ncbi:UNVERIFIED_CONTAM: hypothetical protein FKN15_012609 [Acipenser sinensis]